MSTIKKLGGDGLPNLDAVLAKFEDDLNGWANNLDILGKNIEVANVEQPSWIAYYDQIAVKLENILDYCEALVKKVRAERMKYIKDSSSKDYTDTAIQRMVDADKEYLNIYMKFLIVKEIYEGAKSIVKSFEQRSYSLNNIVRIRENELENITIRY